MKSVLSCLPLLLYVFISTRMCICSTFKRGNYDHRNIFDPNGNQYQLEFAEQAILQNSGPLCCMQLDDGILFISGRKRELSRLIVTPTPRTMLFDDHRILVATSGLAHDGLSIIDTMYSFVQKHREFFPTWDFLQQSQSVEELVSQYSKLLYHKNDLYAERMDENDASDQFMRRVPGVNLLVAGMTKQIQSYNDESKYPKGRIYLIRPDGSRSQHRVITQGISASKMVEELEPLLSQGRQIHINDAMRYIKTRRFLRKYFLLHENREKGNHDDDSMDSINPDCIYMSPNQIEMFVMYTNPLIKEETSSDKKQLSNLKIGVWQSIDVSSLI